MLELEWVLYGIRHFFYHNYLAYLIIIHSFFLLLDSFGASTAVYIHNSSDFYKTVGYYNVYLFCKVVICAHSISNAQWAPFESAWLLFANSNFCFLLGQVGAPCGRCGMKSSCPKESARFCQSENFHAQTSFPSITTYVQLCTCSTSLWIYLREPSSLHIPTVVVPSKNKSEYLL